MTTISRTTALKKYYLACTSIANEFMRIYYPPECKEDSFWVANEIGGAFFVGDEFWNIDNMVDALENKISETELFQWYYDYENKNRPNLKNWAKGIR